jgi:hypothetical protein
MGKFEYQSGDTKIRGDFNVYQARNGAIILVMGKRFITLTHSQLLDLNLNCYGLLDFDYDSFKDYYKTENNNRFISGFNLQIK